MAKQSSAYFVIFALTCFLCSAMISTEAGTVSIDEIDLADQFSGKADLEEADKTVSNSVNIERKWCIVKPSTPDNELMNIINYVCSQTLDPRYNCKIIEYGGPCYNPSNQVSNASVLMHIYYQVYGKTPHSCYFNGSGITIDDDPSVGNCIYPLF